MRKFLYQDGNEGGGGADDPIVKFTSNGVERSMPMSEALKWAAKAHGADEKFNKASELVAKATALRQSVEADDELTADIEAIKTSKDPQAFMRIATRMGVDEGSARALWTEINGMTSNDTGNRGTTNNRRVAGPVELPDDAKAAVAFVKDLQRRGFTAESLLSAVSDGAAAASYVGSNKMLSDAQNAIDKHPALSRMFNGNRKGRDALANRILSELKGRSDSTIPYTQALSAAVEREASMLGDLGLGPVSELPGLSAFGGGGSVVTTPSHPPQAPPKVTKEFEKTLTEPGSFASFFRSVDNKLRYDASREE